MATVRLASGFTVDIPEYSLEPGYACTVHKAQGSEYDIVVLVLFGDMAWNLKTRELAYTAVTRAKQKLYIVGAIDMLMQLRPTNRNTIMPTVVQHIPV